MMIGGLKRIKKYIHFGYLYLKYKGFKKNKQRMSRCEAMIKSFLSHSDVLFKSQYHIKLPRGIRKTNNAYIDFMVFKDNKRIAIEYNGEQHYKFSNYFHKTYDKYLEQRKRDIAVKDWCNKRDITFLEIPYTWTDDEIISKIKEVIE